MEHKFKYEGQLPKFEKKWGEKKQQQNFGACTEGYIATECWVGKVNIILYHCCVILLRFDNCFLSAREILFI